MRSNKSAQSEQWLSFENEGSVFTKINTLGTGGFGSVFLYEKKSISSADTNEQPERYALKILDKAEANNIYHECENWVSLGYNAFVLTLDSQLAMAMPFFEGINMDDHLKEFIRNKLNETIPDEEKKIAIVNEILKSTVAMLNAINALFQKGFVHPDAYMDNILYNSENGKAHYIDLDALLRVSDNAEKAYIMTDLQQSIASITAIKEYAEINMGTTFPALDTVIKKLNACLNTQDKNVALQGMQKKTDEAIALVAISTFDLPQLDNQKKSYVINTIINYLQHSSYGKETADFIQQHLMKSGKSNALRNAVAEHITHHWKPTQRQSLLDDKQSSLTKFLDTHGGENVFAQMALGTTKSRDLIVKSIKVNATAAFFSTNQNKISDNQKTDVTARKPTNDNDYLTDANAPSVVRRRNKS